MVMNNKGEEIIDVVCILKILRKVDIQILSDTNPLKLIAEKIKKVRYVTLRKQRRNMRAKFNKLNMQLQMNNFFILK